MDLTSSSSPAQYIFPILKHSEILQCLSELSIDLNKAELAEPARHKEKVKKVFLLLIDICCGLSEEDFLPNPGAIQLLEYPELHEGPSDTRFMLALRKWMKTCGIDDFGFKDLYCPTPKRFRCQLSAAINMAKFREEQLKLYAELNEPRMELLRALEEVNEENRQLSSQYEVMQIESDSKFQEMEEVQQECDELEKEIAKSNKIQAAKREESTELKKRHNDLNGQLAMVSLALQEAHAEYEMLQTQIVSSPERRKREVQDTYAALEYERQEIKALDEEIQKNKIKKIHMSQAIKDVLEATTMVKDALETSMKRRQMQEQLDKTRSDKDAVIKETAALMEQMVETQGDLKRLEEKRVHNRKVAKVKLDDAEKKREQARAQLLEAENEHLDRLALVDAWKLKIATIQATMEQEQLEHQAEIKGMITEYRQTERSVLEQNAKLMVAIGEK